MLAFDCDGTLAIPWWENTNGWPLHLWHKQDNPLIHLFFHIKLSHVMPYIKPVEPIIIMTDRHEAFRSITQKWAKKQGIQIIDLVMPPKRLAQDERLNYKTNAIRQYGITTYVEDEIEVMQHLKQHTTCNILSPAEAINQGLAIRLTEWK